LCLTFLFCFFSLPSLPFSLYEWNQMNLINIGSPTLNVIWPENIGWYSQPYKTVSESILDPSGHMLSGILGLTPMLLLLLLLCWGWVSNPLPPYHYTPQLSHLNDQTSLIINILLSVFSSE
jgi:hypothetical protein